MFEIEIEKFKEIQAQFKPEYPNGGFVVIKGNELLGIWHNRLDALRAGIDKYGNVPFLVKDIRNNPDDVNNAINFSRNIEFI